MSVEHDRQQDPSIFLRQGGTHGLSGKKLVEIMLAVLNRGASLRFLARGTSMYPFIRDRDIITVRPLGEKMPNVGQIVAFIDPDGEKLVVHRIIGQERERFLLQGDNVAYPDGLLPPSQVVGIVDQVERSGRCVKLRKPHEALLVPLAFRLRLSSVLVRAGIKLSGLFVSKPEGGARG